MRIALVGCGRIAQRHAALLGKGWIKGAELVAVCDVLENRARELGLKYDVHAYLSMLEMTEREAPDLVSILTPSGMHPSHAIQLASLQVPLLVEKPLALRINDALGIIEMCKDVGIELGVVKQNRYNVAVRHLRYAIAHGLLGDIHAASVRVRWRRTPNYYLDWHGKWSQAGGVLANQAIHHVDLLQWLIGDVKHVTGFAQYRNYTEVEVGLVASLQFWNGAIGTIEASTLTAPKDLEGSLSVMGSAGTIELGGFACNKIVTWEVDAPFPENFGENPPDVYGFGHFKLYEDIVNRFEQGLGFPTTGEEAIKSIAIVNAIYEAVETGETVEVDRSAEYPHSRLGRC